MKVLSITVFLMIFLSQAGNVAMAQMPEDLTEKKITEIISQMTLEEKVGQMTQITLQAVSKKQGTAKSKHEIDRAKLEEAILKYNVGSILNVYDVAHELDYWHELITMIQDIALNKSRMKIPVIYGIDAIHGANYTMGATLFPQSLALASTWNRDLAAASGKITTIEAKASGIPWNFNPVMDLGRQVLWPRLWETYGEDVYLASQLGDSYIRASHAQGNFATCLKHYVGYSFPINGLDRTPAWISERMLREYFLPPFETGLKAGAKTVMINSSEVDGIPGHANYHLLTEVLKEELKFDGFTVSDWEDIIRLYTRDKVAASPKDAVRIAVMAGVDMSMVPYDFSFFNYLVELVKEGTVPLSRIDDAVRRILRVKFQTGLFENAYPDKSLKNSFATPESKEINLRSAEESVVLLKNKNNILPLKKGQKILVTGPTANMLSVLNGGWTITWQGNEESLYPQEHETVLEAVQRLAGADMVSYSPGSSFDKAGNTGDALKLAENSDVIVLCLGEPPYCETPGNISDLTLPAAQIEFAEKMIATGKPVVVVMLQGRPRLINGIAAAAAGVVNAFLPGMEGGTAIARVLFGEVNPSGKLPVTYPAAPNGITLYDHKPIESGQDQSGYKPLYPFGFGLSYTEFAYSGLKISSKEISMGQNLTVSVDVTNKGKVTGKEVVQLYLTDLVGSVTRPNKQLKGFEKVELKPGETKTVTFTITDEHMSFIGQKNKRITEPGDFKVTVGGMEAGFTLKN